MIAVSISLPNGRLAGAQEFTEASQGAVLASGTLIEQADGSLACNFGDVAFGTTNSADVTSSASTVQVTEDCRMVVVSVDKRYSASASSTSAVQAYRTIYAEAVQRDVIGLGLTRSHAQMGYTDSGGSVYGGGSINSYCWNALDGWYGVSYQENWNPNGPSSVWIWRWCTFAYIGGTFNHTLDATVYGWPGGAWQNSCNYWGSIAPGGYIDCYGGQW